MQIAPSELILNSDGSIYHLELLPDDIADTIITVGDPDRVNEITKYFEKVEITKHKREFHTQTGYYQGKRITVISTGIGTDNIDIVLNELDALVNIDFSTRTVKEKLTSLNIIRVGTSGAIQPEIPLDSVIISEIAIGFDNLLHFYESAHQQLIPISKALVQHLDWIDKPLAPYAVACDKELSSAMQNEEILKGITVTNTGFYGPQSRELRLPIAQTNLKEKLQSFSYSYKKITNLEMETSGIYGLSKLLNHRAVSLNAILANRATGEFSNQPKKTVERLITHTLQKITEFS